MSDSAAPQSIDPEDREFSATQFLEVRRGDEAVTGDWIRGYYRFVAELVRHHVPGEWREESLVELVFVTALRNLGSFKGRTAVGCWLGRETIRCCAAELRRDTEGRQLDWMTLSPAEQQMVTQLASEEREILRPGDPGLRDLLRRLILVLPAAERFLLNFVEIERRSIKEAAAITGWPKWWIKLRLLRAHRRFYRVLDQLLRSRERSLHNP